MKVAGRGQRREYSPIDHVRCIRRMRRRYCIIDHEFYYKSQRTGPSGREGPEASFARFLPSRREYVVGQVI